MGVPRYMVSASLQVVLAQRLVRVICESCTQPYQLSTAEQEWLAHELGADFSPQGFQHGRGCAHCNGMGYRGRTGVYEMLEMTPEVAHAASHHDPMHLLKVAHAQMAGMTLRAHAVALAQAGRTTVAEAMRISNQMDD